MWLGKALRGAAATNSSTELSTDVVDNKNLLAPPGSWRIFLLVS
jgi:hypothetical protein